MIEVFGIEAPLPAGIPLLIVYTDRQVHKAISQHGGRLFRLCDNVLPDLYISESQIIGWTLFDSLTTEDKALIGTKVRDDRWSFKERHTEFHPIAFEKEAGIVPPNNTLVTLLMPSGLLVESTTRASGFFPESDQPHDCGKSFFSSDDIVGWATSSK